MPQGDVKPHSWRELAKQVSEENDHNRVLQLVDELISALDAESRKRMEQITPKDKVKDTA